MKYQLKNQIIIEIFNYEKTSPPQPAIAENRRGEKSRAGFIGAPQLKPKANIINPKSVTPIAIGTRPIDLTLI